MEPFDFRLSRNALGRLEFVGADGEAQGVVPVRAFPIAAPTEDIALVSVDGRELAWIGRLADLPEPQGALVAEALAQREFMPEIVRLMTVSSFATPSTWQVATDRGETAFVLKAEDDIRRLPGNGLLIADSHGIQFRIRDIAALDRHSRRLLDRFL